MEDLQDSPDMFAEYDVSQLSPSQPSQYPTGPSQHSEYQSSPSQPSQYPTGPSQPSEYQSTPSKPSQSSTSEYEEPQSSPDYFTPQPQVISYR